MERETWINILALFFYVLIMVVVTALLTAIAVGVLYLTMGGMD